MVRKRRMLLRRLKANLPLNRPELPEGVGPHTGRELEFMLSGQKLCALFFDVIPENGKIPEEIIPEAAFAPYIAEGRFLRFSKESVTKTNRIVRYVCFTSPTEAWRADAIFWLSNHHDDAADIIIGRLLGYTEDQINAFLVHAARLKSVV